MANSAWFPISASTLTAAETPRHSLLVRITHWVTTLCFVALLVTGAEIVISHPRFYWGEAGNAAMPWLFKLPIPASRGSVPTGFGYVLPDQNGWSRYLHFQAGWVLVLTGLLYTLSSLLGRHLRDDLLPNKRHTGSYNVRQRVTYLSVIFVLFPLIIWTGLAMSPALVSVFPPLVTVFGGQQSARTIHFFVTILLSIFVLVHIAMVYKSGFKKNMRAIITGGTAAPKERM